MKPAALLIICLILLAVVTFGQSKKKAPVVDANQPLFEQRLKSELERLSAYSGGKLGVTALHIESGKMISQNGAEAFPMASTFKVPIAVQLLTKVDSGKLSLDQMVEIKREDMHPGSGMIAERFNWPNNISPGLSLSVRSLMELMLLISDNSATDVCLRLAGGASAVTSCMKQLGINGIRVDRSTAILIADFVGVTMPSGKPWMNTTFDSLAHLIKPGEAETFSKALDSDPRDTSTPDGMANLLLQIYTKPILKESSKALLLDIMKRCESGAARLKGLLPIGTEVAHKTGTIGMTTNDVGIITLPGDGGHLIVSAFVKSSTKEIPDRERALAEVTRLIFDYTIMFYQVNAEKNSMSAR
ncbi:MAG: class A beta-lactamase [Chryseolinea sp.]